VHRDLAPGSGAVVTLAPAAPDTGEVAE
jgi:hypothetical protein